MSYATQQNLVDRFGERELIELTDRSEPPQGTVDAGVVAAALAAADSLIDSYVGRRYDLPLASVPAQIATVAGDIARYELHTDAPPERVVSARDAALRFLRDVAAGNAVLDVGGEEPAASGDNVLTSGDDRVFTKDSMKEW